MYKFQGRSRWSSDVSQEAATQQSAAQQPQPPSYQAVIEEDSLASGTGAQRNSSFVYVENHFRESSTENSAHEEDEEIIVVDDLDPLPPNVESSSSFMDTETSSQTHEHFNEPDTANNQPNTVPAQAFDVSHFFSSFLFPWVRKLLLFQQEQRETSTPPPSQQTRLNISDLPSVDDVERLNTRQLKELLQRNYVDYKGCVEKHELVSRVARLWHDHHRNSEAAAKLDAGNAPALKSCHVRYLNYFVVV